MRVGRSIPVAAAGRCRRPASTMTCALVPPKPNELTPAMRLPSGQGVVSVTMRMGSFAQGIIGLGCRRCRFGGITPRCIETITLIRPQTPAAHSRCPQLVFTEPSSSGAGRPANTAQSAPAFDGIADSGAGSVRLYDSRSRMESTPPLRNAPVRITSCCAGPLGTVRPLERPL